MTRRGASIALPLRPCAGPALSRCGVRSRFLEPVLTLSPPAVRLEKMRKEGGREGRQKVAIAARRLLSLSKEVEGVEGAENVRLLSRLLALLSLREHTLTPHARLTDARDDRAVLRAVREGHAAAVRPVLPQG